MYNNIGLMLKNNI